ncbi:unnamed protein product [Lactuca saligna]|uniref:Uncharacterized protein n=1 Tax=Lactuca saligna TaxID=75948 RepID=A0AA35Y457_LACSI|nr:unnamed protein product [Lactuca saligna]
MNQPITSLFSSQSTEWEKSIPEDDQDADVMVSFVEIQFDPEDDNIPDHMLISGKFRSLALLKWQSSQQKCQRRLPNLISILHTTVDDIVEAVIKVVEYFNSFSTKVDSKTESNSKVFSKLEEFLESLKESILKIDTFPKSCISQKYLSQVFSSFISNLKTDIAHLLKLVNLMLTDAPPIRQVVQGGQKGVGSSKDPDQGKVVGKVISSQIPTSLPTSMSTTSTTMTSKPLTKGIVIHSSAGSSSSKPPPSKEEI